MSVSQTPFSRLSYKLFNSSNGLTTLMGFTAILFLFFLGGREIWTLETRWANIVLNMFASGDYFHPVLKANPYYDKPLLSYWLIVLSSWFSDGLTLFTLRFSSALSGIISVYLTYLLGKTLWNTRTGLVAGWLLATSYYFVFWGRVASADMLNVCGNLFALWWYFDIDKRTDWWRYSVFFLSIALTSLCKGLLGVVIPVLCLAPHFLTQQRWRAHLNLRFFLSMLPAALVYFIPFWLSDATATTHYSDDGLYLVFKENIVRFFDPWDHQGPIYLYLLYLPVYTLPWAFFLPVSLRYASKQAKASPTWWALIALAILFVFFTLAGSRRSYYTLPMVPLASLLMAVWFTHCESRWAASQSRFIAILTASYVLSLAVFALFFPLYYSEGGPSGFNARLESVIGQTPEDDWQYVLLDVDNKIPMYLSQSTPQKYVHAPKLPVNNLTALALKEAWPELKAHHSNVVFISQAQYADKLREALPDYREIKARPVWGERLRGKIDKHAAVAFVPPLALE